MEKVKFQPPQGGEALEFYVMEETRINGVNYLLVTEEEEGDCEALILKRLSQDQEEEAIYEMVEAEDELEYISKIFVEMLEDVDIVM